MSLPQVSYLAVLAAGVVIFILGGLWYSPVLFAKRWMALMGRTAEALALTQAEIETIARNSFEARFV